ncbi:MAG TPA: hypothetical protein VGD91_28380 [Trebonia sp.]
MRWPSLSQPGPRHIPVVGPTEAVAPRRSPAPSPDYGLPGQPRDTGWQLALRVWQDSDVNWEEIPGGRTDEADLYAADPYGPAAFAAPFGGAADSADDYGPEEPEPDETEADEADRYRAGWPEAAAGETWAAPQGYLTDPRPTRPDRFVFPVPGSPRPDLGPGPRPGPGPGPAFAASPLGAPVAPPAPPLVESDELFRAWQGSVRAATARPVSWDDRPPGPGRARSRGRGRQVLKIGVPAAVIVTVGAGALLMLTGRANEMLAARANTGAVPSAFSAPAAAPAVSVSLSPASAVLAGYPGEHGTAGVNAMWSASGLTLAVGFADGHPAVWRRAPSGSWSLVSAAGFGGMTGHLTAVALGPLGWIAVGSLAQNGTAEPVVYQSSDGMTWTPLPVLAALAGPGAQFLGVAAGPGGYLVVGRQGAGDRSAAALWWSGDLKSWVNGGGSSGNGAFAASAVAVADGFIAVGSENNCHSVWTSSDGRHWAAHDLAKPDGASSATLRSVAAAPSGHVVAAGYAVTGSGEEPIVAASADGGAHLTQIVLKAPGGPAAVTAVTAAGDGFVAAGRSGPAGAQHAVTWTSADGLTWSAATPVPTAGGSQITALAASDDPGAGSALTAAAQRGASPALLTVPAS